MAHSNSLGSEISHPDEQIHQYNALDGTPAVRQTNSLELIHQVHSCQKLEALLQLFALASSQNQGAPPLIALLIRK